MGQGHIHQRTNMPYRGSSHMSRDAWAATLYHCTAEIPVQGPSKKEEREGETGTPQSPEPD